MTVYYLTEEQLVRWLGGMDSSVYIPAPTATGSWIRCLDEQEEISIALERPRPAQSAKGFLLPPAETVARYGEDAADVVPSAEKRVVVGVRACELKAWRYLDKVMLEGNFEDPLYKARRENLIIISSDCVDCAEHCFCILLGGKPFVEETDGADVNLTPLGNGSYLAEPMSRWGQDLISSDWQQASSEQLQQRQQIRDSMTDRLKQQNSQYTFRAADDAPPSLPDEMDQKWQEFAADCVECGACTNVCPTCHCFYLFDHEVKVKSAERVRTWDSCLFSTYHRMAGGPGMKLTPRPELRSRLANRILHKFVYSPQQYGMLGCIGCGRCIEGCLGKIDLRNVIEGLGK